MRVDLLTREYPPHVYGGAGVHVTELAAVLRRSIDVRVHCFDGPRAEAGVTGYDVPGTLGGANPALATFGVDLLMADGRMSYTDLGKATGLSTSAVHQRVRRLEQRGVIRGYAAIVDAAL